MSNLIEKTLMIGFGIFVVSTFLSFSLPFLGQIFTVNDIVDDEFNDYLKLINDVNKGIVYIIDNPNSFYQKEIYYPDNLNITLEHYYANFRYEMHGEISKITIKYTMPIKSCQFCEILAKTYLYQVYLEENLIIIEII